MTSEPRSHEQEVTSEPRVQDEGVTHSNGRHGNRHNKSAKVDEGIFRVRVRNPPRLTRVFLGLGLEIREPSGGYF